MTKVTNKVTENKYFGINQEILMGGFKIYETSLCRIKCRKPMPALLGNGECGRHSGLY